MFLLTFFFFFFVCLSLNPTFGIAFNQTTDPFLVNIEMGENQTFLLSYNLTSSFSYYITFRQFEQEQWKFGLFTPSESSRLQTLNVPYREDASIEQFYYLIVCFHFLRSPDDIDVQCKDIRYRSSSNVESFPSYKPLFVPLMYALSVLMLLPVIVQHRHRKRAQFLQRRKELRRLSISIAQDRASENGTKEPKAIPIQIELLSFPSSRTLFDQIDDNDNVTFTEAKPFEPYFSSGNEQVDEEDEDEEEEIGISADECIAHLLNNAPWTTDTATLRIPEKYILHEQEVPMISATEHYDDHRTQYSSLRLFRSNPAFVESDV